MVKPSDPKLLADLDKRSAKFNGGGCAQLRFEAIDALEVHFQGAAQSHAPAIEARDFTIGQGLGFKAVEYSGKEELSVKTATPHPRPGYILTKSIDPYGRPVSFVFAGNTNKKDGSEQFLKVDWMSKSVNAALAASGNAYPAFYTGLPVDLRKCVSELAKKASTKGKGFWPKDRSTAGEKIADLAALQTVVIWPKLFRRLVSYFQDDNNDLSGFDGWLRADEERDDALWILSDGRLANMHDVIEVSSDRVKMRYSPADLIITPR